MLNHQGCSAATVAEVALSTQFSRPTFLMCSPQWYDVGYVIKSLALRLSDLSVTHG